MTLVPPKSLKRHPGVAFCNIQGSLSQVLALSKMVIFAWERNTEAERGKMVIRERASRVKKSKWNDFHEMKCLTNDS